MSEEQEKDQLGLWEKLSQLYGENASAEGEAVPAEQAAPEVEDQYAPPPVAQLSPDSVAEADSPESPAFPGPVFRLEGSLPESGRPGQPVSMNAHGRVHETCARCRRSCKQNGRKLNRMLCIGFLPVGD